jgi:hypothetical protein
VGRSRSLRSTATTTETHWRALWLCRNRSLQSQPVLRLPCQIACQICPYHKGLFASSGPRRLTQSQKVEPLIRPLTTRDQSGSPSPSYPRRSWSWPLLTTDSSPKRGRASWARGKDRSPASCAGRPEKAELQRDDQSALPWPACSRRGMLPEGLTPTGLSRGAPGMSGAARFAQTCQPWPANWRSHTGALALGLRRNASDGAPQRLSPGVAGGH